MRYIAELERKVQTLQTEATSLSAQLTLLQVNCVGSGEALLYHLLFPVLSDLRIVRFVRGLLFFRGYSLNLRS